MTLMTIDEYNLRSQSQGSNYRIRGFAVHSDLVAGVLSSKTEERLGIVADVLLDDMGRIQYVIIDLPSGRQVSLPADQARIDHEQQIVYAGALTREQAEQLPVFNPQARS